jgi:DNA modification methylase
MQKRITWKVEKRKLADLKPHPKNPRQFTEKGMKDLENSINSIGFMQPININQDGTILSGHARAMKLKQLGDTEVDVYVPDRLLTPKQEEEVLVRANANTAGQWDFDILANQFELEDINEWGLELEMNVEDEAQDIEIKNTKNDNEIPNFSTDVITKIGDLYQLGNHRLLCGDATNIKDVKKLMENDHADLIFTDPPYNVNVSNSQGMTIQNDNMAKSDFKKFIKNVYDNLFLIAKNGCVYYIFHGESERVIFTEQLVNAGFKFAQNLIWVKSHFTLSRQDYNWRHEPILYGWKEGASHYFCKDFTQDTILDKERTDIKNLDKHQLINLLQNTLNQNQETIIYNEKTLHNDLHPTMKPLDLCLKLIQNSSKINDKVVDLFAGSGTTIIACEKIKRKCFAMELDPKYCDVIVRRYIDFCKINNINYVVKKNNINCLENFLNNEK